MKKIILTILLCSSLVLGITGCGNKIVNAPEKLSILELKELQEQITTKVSEQNYDNFASISIDEKEKVVIVELVDNSKEKQEWFIKNISDYKYIKFKQGGPYTTSRIDFYISKPEVHNDIRFNDYYSTTDRTIYLAGNIDEFYIIDNGIKETFKNYISTTSKTFYDIMRPIVDNLTNITTMEDGGYDIYKSNEKDITIVVCNTFYRNTNIYIGDYSMGYDNSMCK